jgi:hypothetical protein
VDFSTAAQYVGIANVGTTSLNFLADPAVDADFSLTGSSCPLAASLGSPVPLTAGATCSYAVVFAPQTDPATDSPTLVVTDDNLNASSVIQTIQLSGTALPPPETTATSITFTPGPVMDVGQTVIISGTVSGTVTPTGMVSISDGSTVLTSCATLDGSGNYTYTYTSVQGVGTHVITVTYLPGGNNELYVTTATPRI